MESRQTYAQREKQNENGAEQKSYFKNRIRSGVEFYGYRFIHFALGLSSSNLKIQFK